VVEMNVEDSDHVPVVEAKSVELSVVDIVAYIKTPF